MKLVIGCDEAGFAMKQEIFHFLKGRGNLDVTDIGCHNTNPVLYPDFAIQAALAVQRAECQRAILICGTGIGMAITANKLKGIRAAVCHDILSTERSILSNNAQIMCLGARVIAPQLALLLVQRWLELKFVSGPSSAKIARIEENEIQTFRD